MAVARATTKLNEVDVLLEEAANGSETALNALGHHFFGDAVRFARSRGAADPEATANRALYDALRSVDRLRNREERSFRSYVLTCTANQVRNEQRAPRLDTVPLDIARHGAAPQLDPAEQLNIDGWFHAAVDELPSDQKAVIIERFEHGNTIRETALSLDKTPDAVKNLQSRALVRLRRHLLTVGLVILAVLAILAAGRLGAPTLRIEPADPPPAPDPLVDIDGLPTGVTVSQDPAAGESDELSSPADDEATTGDGGDEPGEQGASGAAAPATTVPGGSSASTTAPVSPSPTAPVPMPIRPTTSAPTTTAPTTTTPSTTATTRLPSTTNEPVLTPEFGPNPETTTTVGTTPDTAADDAAADDPTPPNPTSSTSAAPTVEPVTSESTTPTAVVVVEPTTTTATTEPAPSTTSTTEADPATEPPPPPPPTPPAVDCSTTSVTVDPGRIWPPTREHETITATIEFAAGCDPATTTVALDHLAINGDRVLPGHRDVADAEFGTDDRTIQVRARRDDDDGFRTYTITWSITDANDVVTMISADVAIKPPNPPADSNPS
ncbi:MAG: sigma-70 family RNA polymerase sigma factor [Actinomycetota bacterium]